MSMLFSADQGFYSKIGQPIINHEVSNSIKVKWYNKNWYKISKQQELAIVVTEKIIGGPGAGVEFRILCREGSVNSFISPSSF